MLGPNYSLVLYIFVLLFNTAEYKKQLIKKSVNEKKAHMGYIAEKKKIHKITKNNVNMSQF